MWTLFFRAGPPPVGSLPVRGVPSYHEPNTRLSSSAGPDIVAPVPGRHPLQPRAGRSAAVRAPTPRAVLLIVLYRF